MSRATLPMQRRKGATSVLIAAVAIGLTVALTGTTPFTMLELKGLDLLFALRGAQTPPQEIVVVAIDEPSFSEIGEQWPWPRGLHARLLRALDRAGAKVVGFDVLFAEPSNAEDDEALASALGDLENVVLVSELSIVDDPLYRHTLRIDPIPQFRDLASVGIPMISVDPDGAVRRARIFAPDMPSFAFALVKGYRNGELEPHEDFSLEGVLPADPTRELLIDFYGPPRTIRTVSYYQALDPETLLPEGLFKDKIVLVGRSVDALPELRQLSGDTFLTPYSWTAKSATAGVEIQAAIVGNLLDRSFVRELARSVELAIMLALVLAASVVIARLPPVQALLAAVLLAAGVVCAGWAALTFFKIWVPVVALLFALGLTYGALMVVRTVVAERERVRALETLTQNLDAEVQARTQALDRVNRELRAQHDELERAYRELALAQEHLVQSEKMSSLGLLVAGVAHELNNPISYVHSNLEFVEEYTDRLAGIIDAYSGGDELAEAGRRRGDQRRSSLGFAETLETLQDLIKSCKDGAERVKKIVLDLRNFSRTDDTGLVAADLREGIESSLNLLSKQYKDRVTIHRAYGELPLVDCFPGQINQVFMNVLQNALQAIPERGELWIRTEPLGERVKVSIRDTGVGIPAEQLARIFDPFFTTKPVGAGTGLGLSISYGIVTRHGGKMSVTSSVGQGTELVIELPIHAKRVSQ